MTTTPASRYHEAVRALALRPGLRVLEVGCGHGVAVTSVCDQLGGDGHVHAIDRSPTMIDAARRRNRDHVAAGTASFGVTRVQDARFEGGAFDRVLALRVREVVDDPAVLPLVRRWLRPAGLVCLVVDAPDPAATRAAADRTAGRLRDHGFAVDELVSADGAVVSVRGGVRGQP
jgi:ubiquinone/menaquinone biosynthesis C-methylase UbiE